MIETLCLVAEAIAVVLAISMFWNPWSKPPVETNEVSLESNLLKEIELDLEVGCETIWNSYRKLNRELLRKLEPSEVQAHTDWLNSCREQHVRMSQHYWRNATEESIDVLTNVLLREAFLDQVKMDRESNQLSGCLLMLDFDQLKSLNDEKGMASGDLALKQIGACLKNFFSDVGLVGRFSGGRFVIWLSGWQLNKASTFIECRRTAVSSQLIQIKDEQRTFSLTGAMLEVSLEQSINGVLERIEEGFLEAKLMGLDCLAIYTENRWEKVLYTQAVVPAIPVQDELVETSEEQLQDEAVTQVPA